MKRWEYRSERLEYDNVLTLEEGEAWQQKYTAWLNGFGHEGWELVKIDFAPANILAIFKRKVIK